MAKIVQIVFHPHTEISQGAFMCLCEDGSIWDYSIRNGKFGEGVHKWHPMSTPDSERDEDSKSEVQP